MQESICPARGNLANQCLSQVSNRYKPGTHIVAPKELLLLTLSAAMLLISGGCHPWFESRYPWEENPDRNQTPVITTSDGSRYESGSHYPGTPSYVPLIDACLSEGGSRGECIESLPPEELAKLEAEEARRGAMRRRQIQWRQAYDENIAAFGFATIDLPAGWLSRVEKPSVNSRPLVIEYFQPGGAGVLKMQILPTPVPVTQAQLRNLTNVDPEIPLAYENRGDFVGYHFEQIENNTYYRHWWLAESSSLILITYQCEPDMSEAERAQVDSIINSLRKQANPDSGYSGRQPGDGFE
jgi:hypothetical protein